MAIHASTVAEDAVDTHAIARVSMQSPLHRSPLLEFAVTLWWSISRCSSRAAGTAGWIVSPLLPCRKFIPETSESLGSEIFDHIIYRIYVFFASLIWARDAGDATLGQPHLCKCRHFDLRSHVAASHRERIDQSPPGVSRRHGAGRSDRCRGQGAAGRAAPIFSDDGLTDSASADCGKCEALPRYQCRLGARSAGHLGCHRGARRYVPSAAGNR